MRWRDRRWWDRRLAGRRAEFLLQYLNLMAEDASVTARSDGEPAVVIADDKAAGVVGQSELALFENFAVHLAEHGQQHLIMQFRARRGAPGDIEIHPET